MQQIWGAPNPPGFHRLFGSGGNVLWTVVGRHYVLGFNCVTQLIGKIGRPLCRRSVDGGRGEFEMLSTHKAIIVFSGFNTETRSRAVVIPRGGGWDMFAAAHGLRRRASFP